MRQVFDGGRNIDWSATSDDYATFRPGPPDELYERLKACGIGKQGEAFDREHAALLERIAPERFTVRHGIDARALRFSRGERP